MKTRLLLMSMLVSFVHASNAAPPVVTGVTASQRTGTKIVDISYNLQLDAGQSAFVELWFSPDNGLTYPIRCLDVQGAVDSNITGGNGKSVEWNAESDWDQKFTSAGKIRVIATYGDEPSGFGGSGSGGSSGGNSGSHDASMKPIPMTLWLWEHDPGAMPMDDWRDRSEYFQYESPGAIGMLIDQKEVTNGLWDEVVDWASQNNAGYTGLTLKGGDPDLPVTNITYWEAIKWCNARSEKDGLTPAYYTDPDEATGDINGNGVIDTGVDIWYPHDPHYDPNMNGKWDAGENFDDTNPADGPFNPKEYQDSNGNGLYDSNLNQAFKQGALIALGNNDGMERYTKQDTNGYRLPAWPVFAAAVSGGNYKKNWPWGDQSFPGSGAGATEYDIALFSQKYRMNTNTPDFSAPTKAPDRQPNGFDLYDMLGNVAEWDELAYNFDDGVTTQVRVRVNGGSYLGINQVGNASFGGSGGGGAPGGTVNRATEAQVEGSPNEKSEAIGFRCMVYLR